MNVTITLLIYWSIAVGLIGGGLFALAKGCKLVLEGKGKTKEENSIEFFGIKANVSSVGSLVMITAFMWGWAAKLALPSYKDAVVEIHALRQELKQTETALASLKQSNFNKIAQVAKLEERLTEAESALKQSEMVSFLSGAKGEKKERAKELEAKIVEQDVALAELQEAVKADNRSKIEENSIKFEKAAAEVKKSIMAF
jgi:multidrug efflux pump subunit AcrA (membrane-fusion protein)